MRHSRGTIRRGSAPVHASSPPPAGASWQSRPSSCTRLVGDTSTKFIRRPRNSLRASTPSSAEFPPTPCLPGLRLRASFSGHNANG